MILYVEGVRKQKYLFDHEFKIQTQGHLKDKFGFIAIKPHDKDINDHIWCSKALLWQPVQSWEQELVAEVTTS